MIFFRLLNLFCGYVYIIISGKFPERLLNLFSKNKIRVWNITKKDDVYFANIKNSDFKKIRHFVFCTKTKIKIKKKSGFPFFIYKYRHRYGIIIGIVIFLAAIYTLNLFIWDVEISGNTSVSKTQIADVLQQSGAKSLMLKNKIDVHKLELELKEKLKIIIWTQIEVKGVKLKVTVKEGLTPPIIDSTTKVPSNIISDVDGVISSIQVRSGKAMVSPGDTVYKGQLLVSGIVDGKYAAMIYPSKASIKVITNSTLSVTIPYLFNDNLQTGEYYKRYSLQFFDFSVKLYIGNKNKYTDFEVDSYKNNLNIFTKETPFTIKEDVYRELCHTDFMLTANQAKIICDVQFYERERILLASETVRDADLEIKEADDSISYIGRYKLEKEIGVIQNIVDETPQ